VVWPTNTRGKIERYRIPKE